MQVAQSLLAVSILLIASGAATAAPDDGQGLRSAATDNDRWRGRLSLVSRAPAPWGSNFAAIGSQLNSQRFESAIVIADYYFANPSRGLPTVGFRASGGIGFSRSGTAWLGRMPLGANTRQSVAATPTPVTDADSATVAFPYLGVGYSGIYPKSGWGFSADVGLMGSSSAGGNGLRVDSGNGTSQLGVDSAFRQMRLRPVLQVGVSYSF
ncbi:hypothetical protein BH09PSE5_BH09PSE5_42320 [soil metagenome]